MSDSAPRIAAFVRETVGRQGFRDLVGYEVTAVGEGSCELSLAPGPQHTQQQGFVHGGVFAAMDDVAAGCAALTLAPDGTEVLTVEFKMNYLRPAKDGTIVARAHVVRAGRTISVMESDVYEISADGESLVATALVTFTLIRPGMP